MMKPGVTASLLVIVILFFAAAGAAWFLSDTGHGRIYPPLALALKFAEIQGKLNPATSVAAMRSGMLATTKMISGEKPKLFLVKDLKIPGREAVISARLYLPGDTANYPAVVYFHGGGWVLGSLETADQICRKIASTARVAVISVDYRLAPEFPFPAAVTDSVDALAWVAQNASEIGIDTRRISVAGDSAGGTMATVVARHARSRGIILDSQILIYPVTDAGTTDTPSYRYYGKIFALTDTVMGWFIGQYLPRESDRFHPDASPLRSPYLMGLPRALIITAQCDVLRDEGEAYGEKLKKAGIPVTVSRYDGMVHGFVSMDRLVPHADRAFRQIADFLKESPEK